MQKVNSPEELRRSGRLAVVEGRNTAVRLAEALRKHLSPIFTATHSISVAEATDEGSIAYAVKLRDHEHLGDRAVDGLRRYAAGWLDCLKANAVYEHIASVEVLRENEQAMEALREVFPGEFGDRVLRVIRGGYSQAKRAALAHTQFVETEEEIHGG